MKINSKENEDYLKKIENEKNCKKNKIRIPQNKLKLKKTSKNLKKL
jgi:hypothetical protein